MNALRSSVFLIMTFIFSAILLVYSLLCTVKLAGLSDAAVQLENGIEEAAQENRRLILSVESAVELEELEKYAVNVLGMQHPRSSQFKYIDMG